MTDTPTTDAPPSTETETPSPADESRAFTQADVDRIVDARLKREREATKDLRAKAAEADSSKSEIDRLTERLASLELEANAGKVKALADRVALRYQISEEDRDLFLTGGDEDTLVKQAARLAAQTIADKRRGNSVPREGTQPPISDSDERAFVRELFKP